MSVWGGEELLPCPGRPCISGRSRCHDLNRLRIVNNACRVRLLRASRQKRSLNLGFDVSLFDILFDTHGSVHRRWLSRNTNKMQLCNRIYYSKVYWRLNMFQAAHRSSSGALDCICLYLVYTSIVSSVEIRWRGMIRMQKPNDSGSNPLDHCTEHAVQFGYGHH
jgi:hypothetical protein